MKKFFMIAVMAVAAVTASAQKVGSFFVTPKAGVNLASMTNTNDSKMKVGFIGGAEVGCQTSEQNSITVGVFYSQQGVKGADVLTYKNDYLNIPIMTNYMFAPGFSIEVGLQPAFLLSSKEVVGGNGVSAESDFKDRMNSFDFSLPVGISYEYNKVILEARYYVGLLKCLKDRYGIYGNSVGYKSKNNVFQITLGYKF